MSDELNSLPEYKFIEGEPWCGLRTGKDLKAWGKSEEIAWNQVHRQNEKYKFYIKAFDLLTENNIKGDYFEFGCHRVRTFRMALTEARHHNLKEMNFFAFDSFAGLPKNIGDHGLGDKWNANQLVTTQEEFMGLVESHEILTKKIFTFPGFYKDSLSEKVVEQIQAKNSKVFLACVDCDLYESAVPVFDFLENFLQEGTIIYLDDFWSGYKGNPTKGVSQAFREFQNRTKWKFEEYLAVGAAGKSFMTYI